MKGPWPSIVIERGDKRERVNNDSEQDLTNAFIKVTREGKKTVCFAQGEGEKDIDDADETAASPASRPPSARDLYETKKVLLARERRGARRTARCSWWPVRRGPPAPARRT